MAINAGFANGLTREKKGMAELALGQALSDRSEPGSGVIGVDAAKSDAVQMRHAPAVAAVGLHELRTPGPVSAKSPRNSDNGGPGAII